jgi:endonuclease YncB( thermonuclease family)
VQGLVPNHAKPITLLQQDPLGQLELLQQLVGLVALVAEIALKAGDHFALPRRPLSCFLHSLFGYHKQVYRRLLVHSTTSAKARILTARGYRRPWSILSSGQVVLRGNPLLRDAGRPMEFRVVALALCAALIAMPAVAQRVIDGDTIDLNGTRWRLWGIDAPEAHQSCADGWAAGLKATAAMRKLIEGRAVTCEFRGHDRYKRSIGLCRAGNEDLGAAMVSTGMAWAFTRYSSDYIRQEKAAIGARLGVHAHDCEKAWDWRAQRR